MLCVWVEICLYLRTGERMWRFDAEYKQERMHGETWGRNGGHKYFQKTEGEGPEFLCGASIVPASRPTQLVLMAWRR